MNSMAENQTKETEYTDQRSAQMRKDYMRTTDRASLISSFSRFLGFLSGTTTSALMLGAGFTFNEAIKTAAVGTSTSSLVATGFSALASSPLIIGLFVASLVCVGISIALDYHSGHVFREKGLDQTEFNARRVAHHIAKGMNQSQTPEEAGRKAPIPYTDRYQVTQAASRNDAEDAAPTRSDGKRWIDAVGDLAEQKQAAVTAR